jgi:hypothetical protein
MMASKDHTKRNEFNLDGHLQLLNGGTSLEIDSPRPYGPVAWSDRPPCSCAGAGGRTKQTAQIETARIDYMPGVSFP